MGSEEALHFKEGREKASADHLPLPRFARPTQDAAGQLCEVHVVNGICPHVRRPQLLEGDGIGQDGAMGHPPVAVYRVCLKNVMTQVHRVAGESSYEMHLTW